MEYLVLGYFPNATSPVTISPRQFPNRNFPKSPFPQQQFPHVVKAAIFPTIYNGFKYFILCFA